MNTRNIIILAIIVVVVGAAAFFGGMKYQQSKANTTLFAQNGGRAGGQSAGRFGGRNGAMATIGKVVSSDNNSITVQLQDGSSKIVNISTNTKIVKTQTASISDLSNGTQVGVFGTTNSDGSITAQNIQVNPEFHTGRQSTPMPTQGQ